MRQYLLLALPLLALAACNPAAQPTPEPKESAKSVAAAPSPNAAAKPDNVLSCDWPVNGNKDTAKTVLARFEKDAKRATLGGPEGTEFEGLVLWDDDPARRIEVLLDDESLNERVFGIRLNSQSTHWRLAGLRIGDPMEKAIAANGRAFTLWGFGWDYGGYVSDFNGGKLESMPGGCELDLRFDLEIDIEAPTALLGDRAIQSSDPQFAKAKTRVSELGLNWR